MNYEKHKIYNLILPQHYGNIIIHINEEEKKKRNSNILTVIESTEEYNRLIMR